MKILNMLNRYVKRNKYISISILYRRLTLSRVVLGRIGNKLTNYNKVSQKIGAELEVTKRHNQ
jgi:hypothetical protein